MYDTSCDKEKVKALIVGLRHSGGCIAKLSKSGNFF